MSVEVSVVIPAYNAAETVGAAVESVLDQSLPATEIIVVNDGSTDATGDVLAAFGGPVRVIEQPNQGLAAARSAGQAAATGDYLAWLDADDVALPERLEVQAAVLTQEPSVMVVASDFDAVDDAGRVAHRFARTYHGAISAPGSLERIFGDPRAVDVRGRPWRYYSGAALGPLILGNFLHPPSVMMRRCAAERVGPLNPAFPTSEDWLYFVELARLGDVAFVDEPLISYRQSPDQMSSDSVTVALNNLRSLEFLLSRDPAFASANAAQVRRALGLRHGTLAHALAERDPGEAMKHLFAAARRGGSWRFLITAFAKAALPAPILRSARRLRRSRARRADGRQP